MNADSANIEYVNIGVLGSNFAMVSDTKGNFSVNVPDSLKNGILFFSHISYELLTVPVATIEAQYRDISGNGGCMNIILKERGFSIEPLVVSGTSMKTVNLNHNGGRSIGSGVSGVFHYGGIENVGQMIELRKNSWIKEVKFDLQKNTYDTLVLKLLLYKVEADRFTPLMDKPYYVYPAAGEHRQSFVCDLRDYDIRAGGTVYVRLEAVERKGDGIAVFPAYPDARKWFVNMETGQKRSFSFGIGLQLRGVILDN